MNNILERHSVSTTAAMVSFTAALAVGGGLPYWPRHETPILTTTHAESSYSFFEKSLAFEAADMKLDFASQIVDIYASLSVGQEPLGTEFEAVWDANVASLYEA